MNNTMMNEAALRALVAINGDDSENHEVVLQILPENGDWHECICEDHHNGRIEYYRLKWDDNTSSFVEYIKGDVPDIPPVNWKKIPNEE